MNLYQHYTAINARLARGETLHFDAEKTRKLCYPRIGVYAGTGTSHSWLWFAELFERIGFHDIAFLNERAIQEGLNGSDVLAVSGGDTFAVAEALGAKGSEQIRTFVEKGGLYIGACAGAYLPMNSSKEHLNLFNFADVKITNLSKTLPKAERMAHKCYTAYGCDFIFHPVREEVRLRTTGIQPFTAHSSLLAPMYGGPSMAIPENAEVLACYDGFTEKTAFLVSHALAQETLLGKAAVVRVKRGNGCFYLFGPHFEHPRFPEANKLMADAIYWDIRDRRETQPASAQDEDTLRGPDAKKLIRDIKRELSNSRIVATGLEIMPIHWLIGAKIYEPEKIRVFLEAAWSRLIRLEKRDQINIRPGVAAHLVEYAKEITVALREIKNLTDREHDTVKSATEIFNLLNQFSTTFLEMYFGCLMLDA